MIGPLKCEHAQREKELSLLIILEYLLFVTFLMRLYSFSPHASQRYLVKVWWSCTISQFLPLLTQGKEALCQLLESFPFLQGIVTSTVYRTSWLFPNGLLRPRGFGNELTFTSKGSFIKFSLWFFNILNLCVAQSNKMISSILLIDFVHIIIKLRLPRVFLHLEW